MQQRHATSPEQLLGATSQEVRDRFLVADLFVPGEVRLTGTEHDRVVVGGAVPVGEPLALPAPAELRAAFFLERRELGVVNVGGPGVVTVDGDVYDLAHGACLYVGRGAREVLFAGGSGDGAEPPAFYLFSAPAHVTCPTVLTPPGGGTVLELGDPLTSNRRSLHQIVHEGGVRSCQIVLGVTRLHPGSMWNTMPAHTHARRTECYLYFDVPDDARVLHLCGEPRETRHLVVGDREAVIAPGWSVHSGVGTAAYAFVWAMAGENQAFDDMDGFPVASLR
ncbi:5-dehydro-4-deoxy-D-glucuronate isomerase [Xylanimonas allomyrinae]|uniref:4-deoxy-L-threo-5-hexosulose-uronate ketol-isomerase n=1 Tax=Xylanimonas allomyrinae TaxID=2509459 RepID=A0A4P6EPA9_9MICO|nr:5-dehydro-4-deoxy-D-glucuronate isomerase [Xylanimonas allomyrinae]QAY64592.1 5-dehydro-4-deoxy-D-glucuronate isomerase [Xylanimonas allomyrinae]